MPDDDTICRQACRIDPGAGQRRMTHMAAPPGVLLMTRTKQWMTVIAGASLIGLASLLWTGGPRSQLPQISGPLDANDLLEINTAVSQSGWRRLRNGVSRFDLRESWGWRLPVVCSRISRLEAKRFAGEQVVELSVELTNRWQKGVTWVGAVVRGRDGWQAVGWGKVTAAPPH